MRHGSWLALLCLEGCLYIGGINHPPEGDVLVLTGAAKQDDWVELSAAVTDPDGDEVRYAWKIAITTDDGTPQDPIKLEDESQSSGRDSGVGHVIQPVGEGIARVKVKAFVRGTYVVTLRASDEKGAYRDLTTEFTVKNQPPVINLALDIELKYKTTDRFPDTGFKDGKTRNPAHGHYLLYLAQGTDDHEGDLACGGPGKISYKLLQPASTLLDYWQEVACQPGAFLDQLRFRLDPAKVTQPETIQIEVTVKDGHGGEVSKTTTLPVVPNRPACIVRGKYSDGTAPPVPPLGGGLKVPVVTAQGLTFEVRFVSDDVNEGHVFSWYVRDASVKDFELLQQGSSAKLKLGPWFRMPGQELELRAVVADPQLGTSLPSCGQDAALCPTTSGVLPDEDDCYQWITWRLEFL